MSRDYCACQKQYKKVTSKYNKSAAHNEAIRQHTGNYH